MVSYVATLISSSDKKETSALSGEIYLSTDGNFPNRQNVRNRIEQECKPMYEMQNLAISNILELKEEDMNCWLSGSGTDI